MPNASPLSLFNRYGLMAAFLATLATGPAGAHVIEIDAKGISHTRTASGLVEWVSSAPTDAPIDITALPSAALTPRESIIAPPAFTRSLVRAAALAGISPSLLEAVIWQESRWRPDAISPKGAMGLGQLMPGTARNLGVDPRDPEANLIGAARYLRGQIDRFDGNLELALAAYNAGPGRVAQARAIPNISKTRNYVAAITARLNIAGATDRRLAGSSLNR